jgi:hypothetical protein
MNSLGPKLIGIAGVIALLALVSWLLGWDYSDCDIRCWQRRVEFWR